VLLLHRGMPAGTVVAGIEGALSADSVDPAVVAVEARRSGDRLPVTVVMDQSLAVFDRPPPALDCYDVLLGVG